MYADCSEQAKPRGGLSHQEITKTNPYQLFSKYAYLRWISIIIVFTELIWTETKGANSVDPDQTAPKEQSDQGLHYLQTILYFIPWQN